MKKKEQQVADGGRSYIKQTSPKETDKRDLLDGVGETSESRDAMKNNARVQDVGQKLVDPAEKPRRESADHATEQGKSDNATPKVATSMAKSISEKSGWEGKTEGSDAMNNRHFGRISFTSMRKILRQKFPRRSRMKSDHLIRTFAISASPRQAAN